jgi:hypothetical protein
VYNVLWTSSPLLLCSYFPPHPPFSKCLVGFIMFSSYIYNTSIFFTPQYPFLSFPPVPLVPSRHPPNTLFMFHYHQNHHQYFRSRLHKWVRTCNIVSWACFISFNIISSSINNFIFPYGWVIVHDVCVHTHMYIYNFLHPFIGCWTSQLIPV